MVLLAAVDDKRVNIKTTDLLSESTTPALVYKPKTDTVTAGVTLQDMNHQLLRKGAMVAEKLDNSTASNFRCAFDGTSKEEPYKAIKLDETALKNLHAK